MKLYELAEQYKVFNQYMDDAWDNEDLTEDDLQMWLDTLEAIEDELEKKTDNICRFIKNLNSDIEGFKAEEKRLAKRRKYMENKVDGLKQYLHGQMVSNGIKKIDAKLFKVALQKNPPSAFITNENLIPAQYRKPQPDEILKKELLADLKSGIKIEGAIIAPETNHLRIR